MPFTYLVVDDEWLGRRYISNMIRRYDPEELILEASSAEEALPILQEGKVDILFLDIKMPGKDGFGLLDMVADRNFELVFITAHNEYAIKAIKQDATDYLLKPIKKSDFKRTLERVIEKRRTKLALVEDSELYKRKLSTAEQQLAVYVKNIREKNTLINQLNNEIEQLQQGNIPATDKIDILDALQKNTILTEDDWTHFKEIFEKVYPSFFTRLRDKYNNLTQAEIRLLTLTKLNLNAKEMAGMLGISPESIRQTRWRLRKKIGIPDDKAFEEIVVDI